MTRDQFLCEMMGEKWHGIVRMLPDGRAKCSCGMSINSLVIGLHVKNPNFSDWPDKGRLIDEVKGKDDWDEFREWAWDKWVVLCAADKNPCENDFTKYLLDNFADLVFEYKGGVAK